MSRFSLKCLSYRIKRSNLYDLPLRGMQYRDFKVQPLLLSKLSRYRLLKYDAYIEANSLSMKNKLIRTSSMRNTLRFRSRFYSVTSTYSYQDSKEIALRYIEEKSIPRFLTKLKINMILGYSSNINSFLKET